MNHRVEVRGIPDWADPPRLLGPAPSGWTEQEGAAVAELPSSEAADLAARLRGVGLGGALLEVRVTPPLHRERVRAARTEDARRRRNATPGFTRAGVRLDDEGRISLTPEALALSLGRAAAGSTEGRSVLDAGCGAGGNSIGFARAGCRVTAVERAPARLADARHNAAVYGVSDRIRFVVGDAVDAVRRGQADLLFVDPPWGADWDRARTGLDALPPLADLLTARGDRYAETWLKLPPSFDPAELPGWTFRAVYGASAGDERRVKFVLAAQKRP